MDDKPALEARYRIALEASEIGVWTWEAASGLIDCDDRALELLGLLPGARLTMQDFERLIHEEDRALWRASWAKATDPESAGELATEFRLVEPRSGRRRRLTMRGRVELRKAEPHRVVGALRDVSERWHAEDLTRRSEARFAGIVSIAADAIISVDEEQRITLFNDGAARIFGFTRSEVLGQRLDILLPERFRQSHREHVRRFGASGTSARRMGERAEIYGRRRNGTEFPAEASISHLDAGGERMFTVVLRDISERKQAEAALEKSNSELEARVNERTHALNAEMQRREETQAQLVRTQRMEAFGQLTGGIAHDFNNLLTVITGNLELLEMRLKDQTDRTLLKRAHDAAEMGSRLTGRLLMFARRKHYEIASLNLNDQISGVVDFLRRTLGEPIDLETRFTTGLWTVRADSSEIENAVLNLVINARDAMPRGGRLIIETANLSFEGGQVGAGRDLPAGDYVRLSVLDNGSGMSPDVLERAFEPFFTTKPPGRGTGLGLSTVYGLAQELGGAVAIDSEVGRGTTVSVFLPRHDGNPAVERQAGPDEPIPRSAGETVLLVEDSAEVRHVTCRRLEELGYAVIEAESGPDALVILRSGQAIDVVFSDVVMAGGMSGFDVAHWIRSNRPGLKVLLTSGYVEDVLRGHERQLAGLKILRKPYGRSELAWALRQTLDG